MYPRNSPGRRGSIKQRLRAQQVDKEEPPQKRQRTTTGTTSGSASSSQVPLPVPRVPAGHRFEFRRSRGLMAFARKQWARNKMSALEIQDLGESLQGQNVEGAEEITKLGASGRHKKNFSRDLRRLMRRQEKVEGMVFPELYTCEVWTAQQDPKSWPVLLPHEVIAELHRVGDRKWVKEFVQLPDGLKPTEEWLQEQCDDLGIDRSRTIPIAVHGDAASSGKRRSLVVLSWQMMAKPEQRYLFSAIHKANMCECGCQGRHTLDQLLEIFSWSMGVLIGGAHPGRGPKTVDAEGSLVFEDIRRSTPAGTPLGLHALTAVARGDWEWHTFCSRAPHWARAGRMCWKCKASGAGPTGWTNFGEDAPWRTTVLSAEEHAEWVGEEGGPQGPLFQLPGMTMDRFPVDLLHCLDLGILQEFFGVVLVEIAEEGGGTRKQQIGRLQGSLAAVNETARPGSNIGKLTWNRILHPGGRAALTGKGMATRELLPWILDLCSANRSRGP